MKYSIIIPCFNEEENIFEFCKVIKEELKSIINEVELIFINDGSTDKTQEILDNLIKEENEIKIKIIEFSRNFGKEAAIKAGLEESKGDYISIIDADLQQNPKYILKMINMLNENDNLDSIACYQDRRKEGAIKSFIKKGFYKTINRISDIELYHSASDFRTFRKNVKEAILSMPESIRFSKGIFSWIGFNTYYMSYEVEKRKMGNSKWSLIKLFKYAIDGITSFSTTPVVFSSVIGIFLSVISLICLLIGAIVSFISPFYYISLLILLSLGIQLIFIGILGQYISKTYIETKKRPIYIIKSKKETIKG